MQTHKRQSQLNGTLNSVSLKSKKLLRNYEQIQEWTLSRFIKTIQQHAVRKPVLTITRVKLLEYLPYSPNLATCVFTLPKSESFHFYFIQKNFYVFIF